MKLYLSQIDQLLDLIAKGKIRALLLYGPDKGYIDKICATLIKNFDLLPTTVEYQGVSPSHLDTLLNSQNFFKKKELVKIRSVTASIDTSLKAVLMQEPYNFAVFIGDELPTSSSIRKFFETESYLASIGCYHDDEQKIAKLILHQCAKARKKIN